MKYWQPATNRETKKTGKELTHKKEEENLQAGRKAQAKVLVQGVEKKINRKQRASKSTIMS